jgi:hypothetical protein
MIISKFKCDQCSKEADIVTFTESWVTMFFKYSDYLSDDSHFCSWKCLAKYQQSQKYKNIS